MTPRFLYFDLGWTLEDETPAQWDRAQKTAAWCQARGLEITAEKIIALQFDEGRKGTPAVHPAALKRLGLSGDQIAELKALFPWNPDLCVIDPGALSLVPVLKNKYRLGILANQSRPIGRRLDRYGLSPYFEVVINSCEVGFSKPDGRIFDLAERLSGCRGAEVLMVGDRVDNDVVPAKARGWGTLRLLRGDFREYRSQTQEEVPDFEVSSWEALGAVLGAKT